jgi:hypothetical protein
MEFEVNPNWCSVSVWEQHKRNERFGLGAPTVETALEKLIEWAEAE